MRGVALLAVVLCGCASEPPVDPGKLAPAPAWALKLCPPLPAIPEGDGDPAVRAPHYALTRAQYDECREKHGALVAREKILAKPRT